MERYGRKEKEGNKGIFKTVATVCNTLPSYSNLEVWELSIYLHASFPSLVNGILGDIVLPALLAPLFLQSEEKQKQQQQQNHFLCSVAGVPSKLSNSGSKGQWDMGGVLSISAAMCVGKYGK